MTEHPPHPATRWQRLENVVIAVGVVLAVVALGQPWWLLLVAFLAFDLSALGYLVNQRVGAVCYNLVHSYVGPGLALAAWAALHLTGVGAEWMLMLAACWGFHIAVDRALGFGL